MRIVQTITRKISNAVLERMSRDIDIFADDIIGRTESIEGVGTRVVDHLHKAASGEILADAEENKHREYRF